MGLEKTCEVRLGGKVTTATAHLEPAELRVRGAMKLVIPAADLESAAAKAGVLTVKWKGGTVALVLGDDAEKWALKIRYPRGRIDKLGIKPGMRVAVVGLADAPFLAELRERTSDVVTDRPKKESDVIVVALANAVELPRLKTMRAAIKKNGMIWAVWAKGRKELREDDVRAYGKAAGLVDVKVMSFSDTLSGLKLVIPVKDR
jgi:hypothetical protein